MTILNILVFLIIGTNFAVGASYISAFFGEGENPEQLAIRGKVTDAVLMQLSPLQEIVNAQDVIQTKSQKPTRARTQRAETVELNASPIAKYTENQFVHKVVVPGEDGRKSVSRTDEWPFSAFGVVTMEFDGRECSGTGTLIGSNIVLTAAHNLYSHKSRSFAKNVRFIPAMNGNSAPFGVSKVTKYFTPKVFLDSKDGEELEDYALLVLDSSIGEETGYLGLSILPSNTIKVMNLGIYGYPGDKIEGGISEKKRYYMWGMEGPVYNADKDYITYQMDTYSGVSGTGVRYSNAEGSFIVGVHIKGGKNGHLFNYATALTEARYHIIQSWIKECIDRKLKGFRYEDLKRLDLKSGIIQDYGTELINEYGFSKLSSLNLSYNNITDDGIEILADGNLSALKTLNLNHNLIGNKGVKLIAESRAYSGLEDLYLSYNQIDDEGVGYISSSQTLYHLKRLSLGGNRIGDVGVEAMTKSGIFLNLISLCLGDNSISDQGMYTISNSLTFNNLKHLCVVNNRIRYQGMQFIESGQSLEGLATLYLTITEEINGLEYYLFPGFTGSPPPRSIAGVYFQPYNGTRVVTYFSKRNLQEVKYFSYKDGIVAEGKSEEFCCAKKRQFLFEPENQYVPQSFSYAGQSSSSMGPPPLPKSSDESLLNKVIAIVFVPCEVFKWLYGLLPSSS
jgi:V8-like Glu-specific endopeptidase